MSDAKTSGAGDELYPIEPAGWGRPSGYHNGMAAPPGSKLVFVAGQIAFDASQRIVAAGDFVAQFKKATENVVAVVRAAGGDARHVASMTIFVRDRALYFDKLKSLGPVWAEVMGKHYPAIALVEVSGLLETDALVEIQAIAAIPQGSGKKSVVGALRASLEKPGAGGGTGPKGKGNSA